MDAVDSQSASFSSLIEQQSASLGVALIVLSLLIGFWLDRRAASRRAEHEDRGSYWSAAKIGVVELAGGLASGASFVLGAAILYARIVGHL